MSENPNVHPPVRVEPRGTHWAREIKTYDDRLAFLVEAVGRVSACTNNDFDPNSPFCWQELFERVREVERHAREWADDIASLGIVE